MDIDFIINIFPLFKKAFLLTLEISIIGISLSIIFGFIISLLVFYKVPYLCVLSRIFIEISRNTPLIIQLFFLYFGLSYWIKLPNFWCGVIGVAFLGSSYMAESFRLGFAEIKKIHIESALALGFSKIAIFRHIFLCCHRIFIRHTIMFLREHRTYSEKPSVSLRKLMTLMIDMPSSFT